MIVQQNRQRAELSNLNAAKDKLFALISHDLRSPVATLKNYPNLVDWGALTNDEFTQTTQLSGKRQTNMQTMLENTLNWSLTQMGGLKPALQTTNVASHRSGANRPATSRGYY